VAGDKRRVVGVELARPASHRRRDFRAGGVSLRAPTTGARVVRGGNGFVSQNRIIAANCISHWTYSRRSGDIRRTGGLRVGPKFVARLPMFGAGLPVLSACLLTPPVARPWSPGTLSAMPPAVLANSANSSVPIASGVRPGL
jgi:hypothetical protein